MHIQLIGQRIEENQHAFVDAREFLSAKFGWGENDARLTVLNKCSNVLIITSLGYAFLDKYLSREEWWKGNAALQYDRAQVSNILNEYEMSLRIGLVQNMFYAVESSFRIYVRTIDPGACKNGLAEFRSIYEWILKKTNLQDYLPIFELWRNIRNTMHNNGLFFPSSGKDSVIDYNGTTYYFQVGKPNKFVNTEFVVELVSDLRMLLMKLLQSDELIKYPEIKEIS